MAAAWPQDLERLTPCAILREGSPELIILDLGSKDKDEKAASKGAVDEEDDGSEFAG